MYRYNLNIVIKSERYLAKGKLKNYVKDAISSHGRGESPDSPFFHIESTMIIIKPIEVKGI